MFNYVEIFADRLTQVLEPGEKALALVTLTHATGDTRVGEVEDEKGFDFILMEYRNTKWERAPWKLLGGTTLISPEGGRAVDCAEAFSAPCQGLVTDRRFAAVRDRVGDEAMEIIWQCDRRDIAFMCRSPRGLFGLGRITVGFTDRSQVVLVAGTITWHRANEIVNAFTHRRRRKE